MDIEKTKETIAKLEKNLNNPVIADNMKAQISAQLEKLKGQLVEAEAKAQKDLEEAQQKIRLEEEKLALAKKEGNKGKQKKAKSKLAEAKEEKKEAIQDGKAAENAVDKIEKVQKKSTWGGAGRGQGRKKDPKKAEKAKGQRGGHRPNAGRKKKTITSAVSTKKGSKLMNPSKAELVKKSKLKTVKAFGQTVSFKNDADFCNQLIKAFKKRRSVYKAKGKKTKPVFGVITSKIKDAVSKAMDSVSTAQIEKNPKKIIGKFERLESKAISFLNAFKDVLGSDFKKSEINKEFGDIEASIKNLIKKYKE